MLEEVGTDEHGVAACSDAERRRAGQLEQALREDGRHVRVVALWVRPAWWLVLALCAAVGVAASALAVDREVLGVSLAGGALLVAVTDLVTGALARRVGPSRATQAVVATPPLRSGQRAVTLILTASLDDARRGLAERLPVRLVPATLAALALLTALLTVRAIGADGLWLDVLQLLPTLALLGAIALLLDDARTAPEASTQDAPRAAIDAARALEGDPPANLDVAVVLAGAGDAHAAGLEAWLRRRRRRGLDPVSVAIVHLEPGEARWRERDGVVLRTRPHAQLLTAAQRAAEGMGDQPAAPEDAPAAGAERVTPAGIAAQRGWPAISIHADTAFAVRTARELDLILAAEEA